MQNVVTAIVGFITIVSFGILIYLSMDVIWNAVRRNPTLSPDLEGNSYAHNNPTLSTESKSNLWLSLGLQTSASRTKFWWALIILGFLAITFQPREEDLFRDVPHFTGITYTRTKAYPYVDYVTGHPNYVSRKEFEGTRFMGFYYFPNYNSGAVPGKLYFPGYIGQILCVPFLAWLFGRFSFATPEPEK